jgi:hypothetical protein
MNEIDTRLEKIIENFASDVQKWKAIKEDWENEIYSKQALIKQIEKKIKDNELEKSRKN